MTVEWHGVKILRQAEKVVETNEKKSAKRIEKEAKRLCPVGEFERAAKSGDKAWKSRKPGKLRDAIKADKSKFEEGGWIVYVPAQGSDTYYVRWVELGAPARNKEQWRTSGHAYPVPRQPFLRPALEREKKKYLLGVRIDLFKRWMG